MLPEAGKLENALYRNSFAGCAWLIILLGAALRVWGINFGLPYTIAPDEPTHFKIALHIFQSGDLNPGWLNYPTLTFYINALALIPFYLAGKAMGVFAAPADVPAPEVVTVGVGLLQIPAEFLYARLITAAFGVASLGLIYVLGRNLSNTRWGGILAALFLAVSPAAVYNSHLIRPDTFVVFFVLLSMIFALRIVQDPRLANYVWASVPAGFAVSCKYNVPLVVVPIIVAHFIRYGLAGFKRREIYIAGIASVLAFLLTTPYVVLDGPLFWRGFGFEIFKQAEGHAGSEGSTVPWYLTFVWQTEGILAIAALIQAIRLIRARSQIGLILLSFPVAYYIFINLFVVRNDRTVLPLLPFLHLLAALFVLALYDGLTQRVHRSTALASVLVVCGLMLVLPLGTSFAADLRMSQPDGRDVAREWIALNLPPGARIVQEAYTPYVDTRRYSVQGVYGIVDHSPSWYVQHGFEYLIFSQGNYGRFFAEPDRYLDWIERYNQFFSQLQPVKQFQDNAYEIRIYRTGIMLPPRRIAARFGDHGELVELIGYDDMQWTPGAPLQVRLFWRTLGDKHEPFQVELRLLNQADQEIARTRNDLFQSMGWRSGMFDGVFTLPVPAEVLPGEYRVQVNVIWTRFAYSLPAFGWAEQRIDPVLLPVMSGK